MKLESDIAFPVFDKKRPVYGSEQLHDVAEKNKMDRAKFKSSTTCLSVEEEKEESPVGPNKKNFRLSSGETYQIRESKSETFLNLMKKYYFRDMEYKIKDLKANLGNDAYDVYFQDFKITVHEIYDQFLETYNQEYLMSVVGLIEKVANKAKDYGEAAFNAIEEVIKICDSKTVVDEKAYTAALNTLVSRKVSPSPPLLEE